jgi:NSS family neurotransmitter:Na+ symporter
VGWIWGIRKAGEEMQQGSGMSQTGIQIWGVFVRFVCPVLIFIVLLSIFGIFN